MILLLSLATYLLISYSEGKGVDEELYTLSEGRGYVIDMDRYMEFDIYSNNKASLIEKTDMNSYKLICKDININLENVSVSKYKIPGAYLYKIRASVPDITEGEYTTEASLLITNEEYKATISLGIISFLNPKDYKLLSFEALGASGSYINKHLSIVGFNLRLKDEYKSLTELRCGEFAYGRILDTIDSEVDSIIQIKDLIPDYNPLELIGGEYEVKPSMFIPIAYTRLLAIKETYLVLAIDNTKYYIDTFTFDAGTIDFLEYKDLMEKGVIEYA